MPFKIARHLSNLENKNLLRNFNVNPKNGVVYKNKCVCIQSV